MARWAREHECYVICPMLVRETGRTYNAAVLIDRQGRVVGQYRKIHPTEPELRRDTSPGACEPPVFETDFGTIGIQICFDANWHKSWQRLREKGAKIVFFASAYPAARQVRTLAWLNQYFVVASTQGRASSIYDVTGDVLATTGQYQHWAGAVLPLGKTVFEIDFHVFQTKRPVCRMRFRRRGRHSVGFRRRRGVGDDPSGRQRLQGNQRRQSRNGFRQAGPVPVAAEVLADGILLG